jgi:hypothetical protein
VGLLNLLACAGPRLSHHPLARLNTETMLWQLAGPSISAYLKAAIGNFPAALYPTIFGLRLITDPELGRPNPTK